MAEHWHIAPAAVAARGPLVDYSAGDVSEPVAPRGLGIGRTLSRITGGLGTYEELVAPRGLGSSAPQPTIGGRPRNGTCVEWRSGGVAIATREAVGTLPGVRIVSAAGLNGAGVGRLECDGVGRLRWTAPRSRSPGHWVALPTDGERLLRDGQDADKTLRVAVSAAALPGSAQAAAVALLDLRNNGLAGAEIAASGSPQVIVRQIAIVNLLPDPLPDLYLRLDPESSAGISFNLDNGPQWYTTQTDLDGVAFSLLGGASQPVYIRHEIPASFSQVERLIGLRLSGDDGAGGRFTSEIRGVLGVYSTPEYRFYRALGRVPVPGVDAPYATAATLPHTPGSAFADGVWYVLVTRWNGYIESAQPAAARLEIEGGVLLAARPSAPRSISALQAAGGDVQIAARYDPLPDVNGRADTWALWITDGAPGAPPIDPAGPPSYTAPLLVDGRGQAVLSYRHAGGYADGTQVRVLVRTRRSAGLNSPRDSDNVDEQVLVVATTGASAPPGASWL